MKWLVYLNMFFIGFYGWWLYTSFIPIKNIGYFWNGNTHWGWKSAYAVILLINLVAVIKHYGRI